MPGPVAEAPQSWPEKGASYHQLTLKEGNVSFAPWVPIIIAVLELIREKMND